MVAASGRLAGVPHVRIHDLRHQYASFLVNGGRTLYEVQQILGSLGTVGDAAVRPPVDRVPAGGGEQRVGGDQGKVGHGRSKPTRERPCRSTKPRRRGTDERKQSWGWQPSGRCPFFFSAKRRHLMECDYYAVLGTLGCRGCREPGGVQGPGPAAPPGQGAPSTSGKGRTSAWRLLNEAFGVLGDPARRPGVRRPVAAGRGAGTEAGGTRPSVRAGAARAGWDHLREHAAGRASSPSTEDEVAVGVGLSVERVLGQVALRGGLGDGALDRCPWVRSGEARRGAVRGLTVGRLIDRRCFSGSADKEVAKAAKAVPRCARFRAPARLDIAVFTAFAAFTAFHVPERDK